MKIVATGIGVDAGMIIVADMDYLKTVKSPNVAELERLGEIFEVPNGKYKVSWEIPNSDYGGEEDNEMICEGDGAIEVTSGKIFVCDPCYCIATEGGDWGEWLNENHFGDTLDNDNAFIINSMGGDGCYEVRFNLARLENSKPIPVPVTEETFIRDITK